MTAEQVRIYRAMPAAEKLRLATRLYWGSRALKAGGLRAQHPDWSEAMVERKVRELFLYGAH
jgi:hypothetical protein